MKCSASALIRLLAVLILAAVCSGCQNGVSANGDIGYTPPFLPVTLTVDIHGNIAIHGNASIVTPIGTFSAEANISEVLPSAPDGTLLIIRHKKGGVIVDTVYTVQSQEIVAVVNGRVVLTVTNGRVFVDASKAQVLSVQVRSSATQSPSPQPTATGLPFTDPLTSANHEDGWPHGEGYSICGIEQNGFEVGPTSPLGTNWAECDNQNLNVGDADISVTATLLTDDTTDRTANFGDTPELGCGLIVRLPTFPEVGFSVLPDGQWLDWYSNGIEDVHPANSAIHTGLGVSNVLEIKAVGSSFEFYVNGVYVGGEAVSTAPASGGIGFYTDGFDTAVFRNLVVKAP
jgi:hypothetical protein